MAAVTYTQIKAGLNLEPLATGVAVKGDLAYNSATDKLELYNGAVDPLVNEAKAATLTNKVMTGASNTFSAIAYASLVLTDSIVNGDINSGASIVYSKLSLGNSIVNADINAAAAIAYSKLNLSGSIVNADVNAAAAIAYSKLNLATSIVNADINGSAAIARAKLANGTASHVVINDGGGAFSSEAQLAVSRGGTNSGASLNNNRVMQSSGSAIVEAAAITANRALISDANGIPVHSTVTNTELEYVSGVTSDIQTQIDSIATASTPAGAIIPYAGSTEPLGWLFAYGQSLVRLDYAALFSAIGTTYGAADGTHFNVPDLRGRIPAGRDDMGGAAASRLTNTTVSPNGNTLGAVGGTQTHTLTSPEMPAHDHGGGSHSHSLTNVTGGPSATPTGHPRAPGAQPFNLFTTTGPSGTIISSNGGGGAHLNVQPSIVLNYLIKT
jgi:microcystin-dependent protein